MGLITGDEGKVLVGASPIADITHWTFRATSRGRTYSSSSTGGYERRAIGAAAGNGTFSFALDVENAITDQVQEGSTVTLRLHVDATQYYNVPAVIESLRINVDIDGATIIGGDAEFIADGAWTAPDWG